MNKDYLYVSYMRRGQSVDPKGQGGRQDQLKNANGFQWDS